MKPRIAIVAASLRILGGQGVQAQSLVESLTTDGYDVTFVPIDPVFPRSLSRVRRLKYLRTALNQALYVPSLARLRHVDVVHVFSASYMSFLIAPVPAMLAARLFGKRVILHYHSGEADDHLANWGVLVHPWLRLAHEIVVPSTYLAGVFARHGYGVRVIPNVIDLSRFRFRERSPLRPRLLSTRNLEPIYRVDVVLDAFARLKERRPDATLTVAGYGSEEARLRQRAVDGVRFVGKVDPAAMPALCDDADIFLNASVVDNQPVSILEAFASGLPVVTTGTGDIPSMVRHEKTGLIVPSGDPGALAAAVERLLEDPELAHGLASDARRVVERFTWSGVREDWADVYKRSASLSRGPVPAGGSVAA